MAKLLNMCNHRILHYKENIFLAHFFNHNSKLFADEFTISIYKSKSLLWENMCKYSDRDLGGPSERLPGEKAWPPQTGNAGCLWWTPACSHRGHWRKAKTSIRHQMSRLLIDIYIYQRECDTATNKHEKQRGNLVSFTFFFLFVLNCKMQSIKINNIYCINDTKKFSISVDCRRCFSLGIHHCKATTHL